METTTTWPALGRTYPGLALLMTLFLFGLIGLPLTGRLLRQVPAALLRCLRRAQRRAAGTLVYLVLIAAVNATVGGWYYLRLIAVMFLRDSLRPIAKPHAWHVLVSIWACALITLFGGILPALITTAAKEAGTGVVRPVPGPEAPAGQALLDERPR